MTRTWGKVTVTAKAEKSVRGGHPWIFGEEVTSLSDCRNGDIVDVYSPKGRYLGSGFYNDVSKIRVRLISDNANDKFDEDFFRRRIRYALQYRKTVMPGDAFSCCRLIFGEADRFPGFTVDRFGDILVTQILSLGIEVRKDLLFRLLREELQAMGVLITAIYERNDVGIREKEGLSSFTGFYVAPGLSTDYPNPIRISENQIVYDVDYKEGQKTGFFLDQKYNRAAVSRLAAGKQVLDCFTHTGAFALNMAKAGAASVTAVDISADALAMARHNAELNSLSDRITFVESDVFDFLDDLSGKGQKSPYDFIILDPPAFTKSSATIQNAYRGYKEINEKAMRLLPRGGYLATCSCSHFMSAGNFCRMLREASLDAGVMLR